MAKPRRKVDRAKLKQKLERGFRKHFRCDTVDISDGYRDNIHVMIVSRQFDPMSEKKKQDFLWTIIDDLKLTAEEQALISLVLPVSPAEIK